VYQEGGNSDTAAVSDLIVTLNGAFGLAYFDGRRLAVVTVGPHLKLHREILFLGSRKDMAWVAVYREAPH
jgi:hypothetical protein